MLTAAPARADDIVSARPEAVAVTIYRDGPMRTAELARLGEEDTRGLALIIETRTVDLPAGRSRLRFQGVSDGVIPQSAAVDGLPGALVERNFDYDLLSPGSLIAHSIGQAVTVIRAAARTGRQSAARAVIRSGPDGVVLDFGDHAEALRCGGEAERLVFDHAPAGLSERPTLSVVTDVPRAGRYALTLSYLTLRLDWTADYIARISPDGRSLALTGWITLANRGAAGFEHAPTAVVAGRLSRAPVDIPEAEPAEPQPACWPGQTTHGAWLVPSPAVAPPEPAVVAMMVPAPAPPAMARAFAAVQKKAIESQLGDYKLYTLPEPTTVAARQTKQVMFLDQPAVRFDTVHAYQTFDGPASAGPRPARVSLRFHNTAASGLGLALPAGGLVVRQPQARYGGREMLLGAPALGRDVPKGEDFEIDMGSARDVTFAQTLTAASAPADRRQRRSFQVRVANAKAGPAQVEIRHPRGGPNFRVTGESAAHQLKDGDPLWRLTLPAGGETTLTYAVEYDRY